MDLLQTSASEWQARLQNGTTTSVGLIQSCLDQIELHNRKGQCLNALINVAPRELLLEQAKRLDGERESGKVRGPMHGIPVVVKDIFTTDASLGLPTTCGAHALRNAYGKKNCLLVQRLVDAGMILIGKSNLNEYCRLRDVKSGWSALGGQSQSPYIQDGLVKDEAPVGNSSISGSSSGSSASVAAGFTPVAIGTETTGSVVIPANRGGLYSLKLTNQRAPKDGVLCLSKEFDSVGAMTKSAADLQAMVAIILNRSSTEREKDIRTAGTAKKLPRLGFVNPDTWRFPAQFCPLSKEIRDGLDGKFEETVEKLRSSGFDVESKVVMDDADIKYEGENVVGLVVDAQFRDNFAEFTAGLTGTNVKSLSDLIKHNDENADVALPLPYREQKDLKKVNENKDSADRVKQVVEHCQNLAGPERIDKVMNEYGVDLLVAPGDSAIFSSAALAGYPIGSVPWTSIEYNGRDSRPEGLLVIGKADTEDTILDFMMEYERLLPGRPLPKPLM